MVGSPAGLLACAALLWLWRLYDAPATCGAGEICVRAFAAEADPIDFPTGPASCSARSVPERGVDLLFAALAGPQLGFHWEQVNRRGNEIIFAIDTSRSMLTPDVKPNRLTRAKLAIDDFAKKLDGDAVGIVAFAGTAFLACPVTLDYGAFHESLNALDTNIIPRGGTDIESAIKAAQATLRRRPGTDKILILVTDGEDLEGSAFDAAQAAAKADNLKIYTVGVGTATGDLIPVPAEQGGGFVKDESGAFVKSRLDEQELKAIAGATGGFYVPLGTQAEGLELIFQTVLGSIAKHDLASRQQKIYIERFQWPLAGSLAMLLSSLLMGTRRRSKAPASASVAAAAAILLAMALLLPPARADSILDPKTPVLEYNAGTNAYRAGRFPEAAQSFQQSITHVLSDDPKRLAIQEDAYYNLGNTLYRAGQKTEQSSTEQTLQKWNDAVKAYDTALQLRADDADSKFNRDLVKRKIDALQKQQNQDNQQNKNKNQNKDQNKGSGQRPKQEINKDQNKDQNPQAGPEQGRQQGHRQKISQPPQNRPPPANNPQRSAEPRLRPAAGQGFGEAGREARSAAAIWRRIPKLDWSAAAVPGVPPPHRRRASNRPPAATRAL